MVKSSNRASLVGMRYHGIAQGEAVILPNDRAKLRREPNNLHDRNAIAVEIGPRKVGHIDRDNAAILAPLLDRGASYEASLDPSRPRSNGAIPLLIRIESPCEKIAPPKVTSPSTAGIYRLFIAGHDGSYFGQARDIQDRICQHWDDLNKGVHPNPALRELWHHRGGAAFCAEVFETAPANMSDLVLARWLVDRERHWINHHGGIRGTLNRIEPDLVLNGAAKSELAQERKERERQAKEQRKQDRERYDALKLFRSEVNRKIYDLRSEKSSIGKRTNSATGLRGFLFASADEKGTVPALRARASQLDTALELLGKQSAELESEFMTLKRKLYPGRRRRPPRAYW